MLYFFNFWMLTCKWCFWYVVFEYLIKRKGKKKQLGYFFHKIKIFQNKKRVYQPMNMNPYLGFRMVVNFKSLFFFNYSDVVQRIKVNKYVMFRKIISVVSLACQFIYMYYNWFHKGELRKGGNPYLNKKGSNREIPTLSNHI